MADTYKIIRFYLGRHLGPGLGHEPKQTTVYTGLSFEQAVEHCSDPETSWKTCTNAAGKRRTKTHGPWFDGWTRE